MNNLLSSFKSAQVIRNDPNALAIMFYLYHNQSKKASEIMLDFDLMDNILIDNLEEYGFIEQNPHPEEDKTFVLSDSGRLVIKEIAEKFPKIIEQL